MGLFDGLFGDRKPELDPTSEAARALDSRGDGFESFVRSANDRIEVVPGDTSLFAYIGKPPKAFGVLWFDADGRHDVRSQMEGKHMTRESAARLVQEFTAIYSRYLTEDRFSHSVAGKRILVTPSAAFYQEIADAVSQAQAGSE